MENVTLNHMYLLADGILSIPWLILFALRKDLRKEMLIMSLLATPLAIFDLFFGPTYWTPQTLFNIPIGVEGFLYSFLIGGIAAISYPVITNKISKKLSSKHTFALILLLSTLLPLLFVFTPFHFPNLLLNLAIALIAGVVCIILLRRDLVQTAMLSGLFFACVYFVCLFAIFTLFPQMRDWFVATNMPKIFILGVPLWEVIFSFLFGAYWGSLHETIFGYKYKNLSK